MFDLNQPRTTASVRHDPDARLGRPAPGSRARTLCLPADDQTLARVRPALDAALRHAGWDEPERFDVLVATTEALANAVIHGSRPGGSVGVVYAVGPTGARVSVVDRGGPECEKVDWPPDCPDTTESHGRGLVLIDAIADHVEIESCDGGTRVTMEFVRRFGLAQLAA